jgi:sialic acid synthase SpsE
MWHIKNKMIGENQPVFIIAEAGVNHNGEVAIAHKLIEAAADAGADAVKFQTFITEELVSPETPLAGHHIANVKEELSHFELIKKLQLSFDAFLELKYHAEERGMIFISTPYDIPSAEFLIELGVDILKIASSEITNYPLLDVIRQSRIPVVISTGMSLWEEIVESVNFIKEYNNKICILKCTSNYPASAGSINLRGISKLKETFSDCLVGFSDHSEGFEISLASLGFGICMLERHFTLSKTWWGPDHKASMTPQEFNQFVLAVRKSEKALGSRDWNIQDEELSQRSTMQKGVYAARDIKKGESVTMQDVKFLRPSGGMSPKEFYFEYLNRPAKVDIRTGQNITSNLFED